MPIELAWLLEEPDWKDLLAEARRSPAERAMAGFQRLANSRMDFVRAGQLDKAVQRFVAETEGARTLPVLRLALLGSSYLNHLVPGLRVGALRHGFLLEVYVGSYGMYRQELADAASGLYAFRPEFVCFAFDAQHLVPTGQASVAGAMENLRTCWRMARQELGAGVMQQTLLPRLPRMMGNNENRLDTSQATLLQKMNEAIRAEAEGEEVALLSLDTWAAADGIGSWFDAALWYSAKQEVHPRATVMYGDQVGRVLGAMRGASAKCLVLDLDNTLWGGVIGDDGLEGIVLGQGSAAGEAYLAFQRYVQQMSERGVILAVCSKNDEANALAPFESHPEMVLRRKDIACFVANWRDKATNLREIAATLNIGLDALVFVDDNPAERMLVRSELPMVRVPEIPEDPAGYVDALAQAGYFEAVSITQEDRSRVELYRTNAEREAMRHASTDLESYLAGLAMQMHCESFSETGLKRVVQLIHKTNQFNVTTRRHAEGEVSRMMRDPDAVTLQMRLTDVHGDNGVIALVIGRRTDGSTLAIDTWLMSCRVLGRGVEDATLNLLVESAREMGCTVLAGEYRPTAKNSLVRELYGRLGFELLETQSDGTTKWALRVDGYMERPTHIQVIQGDACRKLTSIAS